MGNKGIDYDELINSFRSMEENEEFPSGFVFDKRGEWLEGWVCKGCREIQDHFGEGNLNYMNGLIPSCTKCGSTNDYSKPTKRSYAQKIYFRQLFCKKTILFGMITIKRYTIFEVYDLWSEKWLKENGFKTKFLKSREL